jgi:hypothetical protein
MVSDCHELIIRSYPESWLMGMYHLILFCLILIKSPFGSASEDFTKFETILLVGGRYQPHIKVWLTGSWDRRHSLRINLEINLVSLDNLLQDFLPRKCYMRKGTDGQV